MATYVAEDLRSATICLPTDVLPVYLYINFVEQPTPVLAYRLTATLLAHLLAVAADIDDRHARGELSADRAAIATTRMARILAAANAELDPQAVSDAVRLASVDPDAFAAMLADVTPELAAEDWRPPREPDWRADEPAAEEGDAEAEGEARPAHGPAEGEPDADGEDDPTARQTEWQARCAARAAGHRALGCAWTPGDWRGCGEAIESWRAWNAAVEQRKADAEARSNARHANQRQRRQRATEAGATESLFVAVED